MARYQRKAEEQEEKKGHNHPFKEKCGPHCPRNEHYTGPERKPLLFRRKNK